MNTTGRWQEELSWLCATTYNRSLPVFIYKYGKVRPGAILKWRQAKLAQQLSEKIDYLSSAYGATNDPRPDVIAHSLGTLLLGRALNEDRGIQVGRVILAGSILRPDFDWNQLIERGQVEAVLNHCAEKDRWVPIAPLVIPGSGPSGTRGFLPGGVVHRQELKFGHSSFFGGAVMRQVYKEVWDRFLSQPRSRHSELSLGNPRPWRPLPALIPLAVRILLLAMVCLVVLTGLISLIVGFKVLIS